MNEIAITFMPSGTGHALYTEAINLASIGSLEIRRASTIEFDNKHQDWLVRDPIGVLVYRNPSRQACLDWEQRYLDEKEDLAHELQHSPGSVAPGPRTGYQQDHVTG